MTLKRRSLTIAAIRSALAAGRRRRLFDGGNLVLPVYANGRASWLFRYSVGRSKREMGLGAYDPANRDGRWRDPQSGRPVSVHGFRATFRTWAGETTAHPFEVVEMALAHAVGDRTVQAYARGDMFERRRRLMEEWADYCMGETGLRGRDSMNDESSDARQRGICPT